MTVFTTSSLGQESVRRELACFFSLGAPPVMRYRIIHPPAEFLTTRERPYETCELLCNVVFQKISTPI